MRAHRLRFIAAWIVALIVFAPIAGAAWTSPGSWKETIVYPFGAVEFDGQANELIQDSKGALYGTVPSGCINNCGGTHGGYAFRLNPPAAGQTVWTRTILHQFGIVSGDGGMPEAGLLMDKHGALFGTTYFGGTANAGTVFELTPPPLGQTAWTERVLHSFTEPDGIQPAARLVADAQGNLYGTTVTGGAANGGTVFMLAPPIGAGAWTFSVIHSFGDWPDGVWPMGLTLGANGVLYGATKQGGLWHIGMVFAISPPAGSGGVIGPGRRAPTFGLVRAPAVWNERILYSFLYSLHGYGEADGANPNGNLVLDGAGALYGSTQQGGGGSGTVFKLSPPAPGQSVWTKTIIFSFPFPASPVGAVPVGGLAFWPGGVLFGVTAGGGSHGAGVVYILLPPSGGRPAWTQGVIHDFGAVAHDTGTPTSLIVGARGIIYGTTLYGPNGQGVIFSLQLH